MQEPQGKPVVGRRRGGGSSVTPLFVAAVPFAAAVFWLTAAFIAPADDIAPFVPGNAVAYLHASGRAAADAVLSASVQMPSGIAPDEVALFLVPGDEAPRKGLIAAWHAPRTPSPAERGALDARGAVQLDATRYLIGDASLAVATRVAAAAHASLADDPDRRRALAYVRSFAAVQAYADPKTALPSDAVAMLEGFSGSSAPFVAGINLAPDRLRVRMMPLGVAAAGSRLGYRRQERRVSGAPDVGAFPAVTAIAEATPSFDLAKLIGDAARVSDHPAPALLEKAGDDLRAALSLPYALWLEPSPAGDAVGYLLRFPGASSEALKNALARYAAALDPDRVTFRLPDGGAAVEFRLDEAARQAAIGSGDAVVEFGRGNKDVAVIGDDGRGGSLIASSPDLLSAFRNLPPEPGRTEDCDPGPHSLVIRLGSPEKTLASVPEAAGAMTGLGLKSVLIEASSAQEIVICGYK